MRKLLIVGAVLALVLSFSSVMAAAPHLVNYQGRLTDPSHNPVSNGSYTVIFAIYGVPTGGSSLWTETQSITTSSGLFSVLLGSVTPIDPATVFGDSVRYLGIQVGSDPELSPRTRLSSVPYALSVARAGGWTENDTVIYSAASKKIGIGTSLPESPLTVIGDFSGEYFGNYRGVTAEISGEAANLLTGLYGKATLLASSGDCIGVQAEANGTGDSNYGIHSTATGASENNGILTVAQGSGLNTGIKTTAIGGRTSNTGMYSHSIGGESSTAVDAKAEGGSDNNIGIKSVADGGQVSTGALVQGINGSKSSSGLQAVAYGSDGFKFGVSASATGLGTNYGVSGYAFGGSLNLAGFFSKGSPGVAPAPNSVVVMESIVQSYLSILGPDIYEKGILFGQPSNEAGGGIIYNMGSVPNGLSFRTLDNSTKMVITSNGDVGIGTITPGERLRVQGNICYTGSIAACSDIRYKREITSLKGSLEGVLQMRGISYKWKQDEYPDQEFDDQNHIGFIAQELEQFYPEMVMTDKNGYKSVDYGRLTPVLVEAIKEQQHQINSQQKQIEELKDLIYQFTNGSGAQVDKQLGQK